ncbi:MAG: AlpA family phage regulatory protein [Burkholderiales bacterium]|nr:AlpA family phage regulatory protein [Xanthomonadaceae bacterium]MBN8492354.1 AlpA family phage regulatory protein [Burkholderiales bacterium]
MMGADLSLLPLREVCARVGLSAATVYRMVAAGTFPAQYRVQGRSLWRSDEVGAWIEAQTRRAA